MKKLRIAPRRLRFRKAPAIRNPQVKATLMSIRAGTTLPQLFLTVYSY